MPAIFIDPTKGLDERNSLILTALVKEKRKIEANKTYKFVFQVPGSAQSITYDVKVPYDIIYRKNAKNQDRYEVRQRLIGKGGQGEVSTIGTLVPQANGALLYKKKMRLSGAERVIKVEPLPNDEKLRDVLVNKRMIISARTKHLYVKQPFVITNEDGSYSLCSIMHRVKGHRLDTIFKEKSHLLTTKLRAEITRELLLALKEQVHDLDLVHRDLKGANIILDIDWEKGKVRSIIIDFDSAKTLDEDDRMIESGTAKYASPEVFSKEGTTKKSDVYALGLLLEELWTKDINRSLPEKLISDMIENNPAKRPDINDAIEDFNELYYRENFATELKANSLELEMFRGANKNAAFFKNAIRQLPSFQNPYKFNEYAGKVIEMMSEFTIQLENHPAVVAEFARILDIKALQDTTNFKDMHEKLVSILGNFKDNFNQISADANFPERDYLLKKIGECKTVDDIDRFNRFLAKLMGVPNQSQNTLPEKKREVQKDLEKQMIYITNINELTDIFVKVKDDYLFLKEEQGMILKKFQTYGTTDTWGLVMDKIQEKALQFVLAQIQKNNLPESDLELYQKIFQEKTGRIKNKHDYDSQFEKAVKTYMEMHMKFK